MLSNEIWKSVKGYEGLYEVSNLGRVKALENWRDLDDLLGDIVAYSDLLGVVLSPYSSIELERD